MSIWDRMAGLAIGFPFIEVILTVIPSSSGLMEN